MQKTSRRTWWLGVLRLSSHNGSSMIQKQYLFFLFHCPLKVGLSVGFFFFKYKKHQHSVWKSNLCAKNKWSANRWMDKDVTHTHTSIKKKETLPFATTRWPWSILCLVEEVRQRSTNTVCYHSHVESKKRKETSKYKRNKK